MTGSTRPDWVSIDRPDCPTACTRPRWQTRDCNCLHPTTLTDTCLQLSASGNSWVSERSHEIFVSDCLHPTTSRVCNCLHLATPGFLKGHTRFSKLLEGCPGCLNFAVRQLFFFEFCTERLSVVLFVYMTV
jgi:hypothetical protein